MNPDNYEITDFGFEKPSEVMSRSNRMSSTAEGLITSVSSVTHPG